MRFVAPIRRSNYLIRYTDEIWLENLEHLFALGLIRNDFETISAALNNFGFLLFKAGCVDEAMSLCQAHYRALLSADEAGAAEFAVQPWINEGRVLMRQGRFADARHHLFIDRDPDEKTVIVAGRPVAAGMATLDVCRNVAIVDGFFLALSADGLSGARRHLVARRRSATPATRELMLQVALARGRPGAAMRILESTLDIVSYPPALICYRAAIASACHDARGFTKFVLLLAALLNTTRSADDRASILHALVWLDGGRGRLDAGIRAGLLAEAVELGDQELVAMLGGRRYAPLPQSSPARRSALAFWRAVLRDLATLPYGAGRRPIRGRLS